MSLYVAAAVMCLLFGLHLQETKADLSDDTCNFTVLEKSLFENEANKIQLSLAFFPLQDNPPEFVKVTYSFGSNTQVWFWSGHTSHFLHPFEVFQFMSLFFSKPEPYYTGRLTLTLRPDCAEPGLLPNGNSRLQLLTHRLKLYAEKGSSSITVSDTYSAKAYDTESLQNLLRNDAKHTANLIMSMAVCVILFSAIVIGIMMCVFFCSKSHTKTKWAEKVQNNQPAVLSFTCLSFILNIYILSLAMTSAVYWNTDYKNRALFSEKPYYNIVPIALLIIVDMICLIFWFILVIVASCCKGHSVLKQCMSCKRDKNKGGASTSNTDQKGANDNLASSSITSGGGGDEKATNDSSGSKDNNTLLVLSSTVLCPIFCVIAHSPYIAIAYLNDGTHASSIFIYYTILCFIFFGVMWLFFNWCQLYSTTTEADDNVKPNGQKIKSSDEKNKHSDIKNRWIYKCCHFCLFDCTVKAESDEERKCCCSNITCKSDTCILCCARWWCFLLPLGFAIFILLGLVVTVTCYFVLIPINKAISDAPNRLVSIYQSGGFLIGSFIVYKVLKYFYSKENEVSLKDINDTLVELKQAQQPNEG